MKPKFLFIGSIGTLAETSELQRQAYNRALSENGIEWNWNENVYRKLLMSNGGQDRLRMLSSATNSNLTEETIEKIHALKTELAGNLIREESVEPRKGIVELIKAAKKDGTTVAWVTTTGAENTTAILEAFDGKLSHGDFDKIFHRDDAEEGKPSSAIYNAVLDYYGADAKDCIAIEDSLNSALSAKSAEIFTVVTLGAYHDESVENIVDYSVENLGDMSWPELKNKFSSKKSVADVV